MSGQVPARPTNRSAVAFVDDSFWYPNADDRWVATDRDDTHDRDTWDDLVELAREKDHRDPVIYLPFEATAEVLRAIYEDGRSAHTAPEHNAFMKAAAHLERLLGIEPAMPPFTRIGAGQ